MTTGPHPHLFDTPRAAWVVPAALALFGTLFVVGSGEADVSLSENRKLAAMPDFSWQTLADGTYTRDLDMYVSDRFPFRDRFVEVAFWLEQNRGMRSDEPTLYTIGDGSLADMERPEDWADPADRGEDDPEAALEAIAQGAAVEGPGEDLAEATTAGADEDPGFDFDAPQSGVNDAPADTDPSPPISSGLLGSVVAATEPPSGPPAAPAASSGIPPAPPTAAPSKRKKGGHIENCNGVLVYQGRAMQMFGGSAGAARAYARVLNQYVAPLKGKVRMYAMVIPTPAAFYLPESHKRRPAEKRNIDNVYAALDANIKGVDAFTELSQHTDEYLYLRTDHHWAARGAYHAYRAFCAASGVRAESIERMTRKVKKSFLGTLYWYTRDPTVRDEPDEVEYFVPAVRYTAQRFLKSNLERAVPTSFLNERAGGYGVFLGADYPLMVAKTSVGNGRRVLLVKNSYGNPFAVFLLSSFEKVVVVDYRYFQGALFDVIQKEAITDLVFMNGAFSANTRYHRNRIGRILYGSKSAREFGMPDEVTPTTSGGPRTP